MRLLVDLLLPASCVGCDRPVGGPICPTCEPLLVSRPVVRGLASGADVLVVAGATRYQGVCRRALLALKERHRLELAGVIGGLLASAVGAVLERQGRPALRPVLLVPIPSRPSARRSRGTDLGLLLARHAAASLRRRHRPAGVVPLLRHVRRASDQVGLTAAERGANLAGALAARPLRRPERADLVLVDDILTTGATLREAARAIRATGGRPVAGAVVAVTSAFRPGPLSSECAGG